MSEWLEIDIESEGIRFYCSRGKKAAELFLPKPVEDLGSRLRQFVTENRLGTKPLVFFIEEDLLFFKKFSFPLHTVNVREAIYYQLSVLTPFNEEVLYNFTVSRGRNEQEVALYAVKKEEVYPYLRQAAEEKFRLLGVYPASQHYVIGAGRNKYWGLLTGGHYPKLILFKGARLLDRCFWLRPPHPEDMEGLADPPEIVYRIAGNYGGEGFREAKDLLSAPPLLKDFNLLPSEYKRPDYLRYGLIMVCSLNIAALLVLGGIKEYKLREYHSALQTEIEEVRPRVRKLQRLKGREKELSEAVQEIEKVKIELDFIRFLEGLTATLPRDSYLDRIRIEGRGSRVVHLQGYTGDISTLTNNLSDLGEVQLRSTRQRQNKTYFHVELIAL